jgi:chorismate mutase / prephenate dehydratase
MRIQTLRRTIDALDRELVRTLNARARLSLAIGRHKRRAGLPLFIHAREREIARNIRRANRGPLSDRALNAFFDLLLRKTRAMVRRELAQEKRARRR